MNNHSEHRTKQNKELLDQITCVVKDHPEIKNLAYQHIESFNYAMTDVLKILPKYMRSVEINSTEKTKDVFTTLTLSYDEIELGKPVIDSSVSLSEKNIIYPAECRERQINYSAPLFATIKRRFDKENAESIKIKLGNIPVMVKSDFCNLKGLDINQLVKLKEDVHDFGGYYIINGNEKLIRMIVLPRRNYPIGFIRPSYTKKLQNCSEYAVEMKCVREDLFSQTISLHYMNDGNCILKLSIKRQEFMIPVILLMKCMIECPDVLIYNRIIRGNQKNSKLAECVEVMIAEGKKYGFSKRDEYSAFLGSRFRDLIGLNNKLEIPNEEVGEIFIKNYILIHLDNFNDKFNMLCILSEKLYLLANGDIKPDNLDSPLNHEILLSGHLYLMVLRERLEDVLQIARTKLIKMMSKKLDTVKIKDLGFIKKLIDSQYPIGAKMENFLATGNLVTKSGLDLKQLTGYSIIAEKLNNLRYVSHFRSVHRGQFFTTMKITTPRKLLPESWGFLCPVHTPDGSPCGLLNHIAAGCKIIARPESNNINFEETLSSLGLVQVSNDLNLHVGTGSYPLILDGKVLGFVEDNLVKNFISGLRFLKVNEQKNIPAKLEIGFVPKSEFTISLQYPGIFLFNCISRMVRKVKNLQLKREEYIGPLEQIYLEIACMQEDIRPETTHQELSPTEMLSLVASLTPFCDYNQSPRNMYQCQMGKQTMGTPFFNFPYRVDNKTFRLLFPQSPIVRTESYEKYGFDNFPSGTNAVVAVLAYTGYDMEDAMILNKSSYERGFGHATTYKTVTKILNENMAKMSIKSARYRLLNPILYPDDKAYDISKFIDSQGNRYIDSDGLPLIGTYLKKGMVEFVYVDTVKNRLVLNKYKDEEPARIEEVRFFYDNNNKEEVSVTFKFRLQRNPVIGDKFSSRHGQKGVLSNLWPQENMPFTESGITPDIIINPHAFPSRMTIGMLIESLAGKSGSLNGINQKFSAFQQFEDDDVIGHFGNELLAHGFNYHGNEIMYSGVSGLQLKAEIFIGVVYYQRLRHMVNDKAQARSIGPINMLTRQPMKGKKRMGGIRFGEMERDALLAHGVSYSLNDRLFKSSDYSEGYVCKECGELLGTQNFKEVVKVDLGGNEHIDMVNADIICRNCNQAKTCVRVGIPYVMRYLTNELAAMNIRLTFSVK